VRRLAVTALAVVGLLAVGVVALLEYISDPLIQSSRHSTYAEAEARVSSREAGSQCSFPGRPQ